MALILILCSLVGENETAPLPAPAPAPTVQPEPLNLRISASIEPADQARRLWIPVPLDDPFQTLEALDATKGSQFKRDPESGTRFLVWEIAADQPLTVTIDLRLGRRNEAFIPDLQAIPAERLGRWLTTEQEGEVDPAVADLAREIDPKSRASVDALRQQLTTMSQARQVDGDIGKADWHQAVLDGPSSIGDWHALAVEILRRAGVPARLVVGPAEQDGETILGCEVQAHLVGETPGWVRFSIPPALPPVGWTRGWGDTALPPEPSGKPSAAIGSTGTVRISVRGPFLQSGDQRIEAADWNSQKATWQIDWLAKPKPE